MKTLFLILALLVGGCDSKSEFEQGYSAGELDGSAKSCKKFFDKQPIGEAYLPSEWQTVDKEDLLMYKWLPFTAPDVQDEHCIEEDVYSWNGKQYEKWAPLDKCYIKINNQWLDKKNVFYYSEVPDQYQSKRDEIEARQ